MIRVDRADARFQLWEALLTNRRKRRQRGEFLIHGVRPLSTAVERGWPLAAILATVSDRQSRWADRLLRDAPAVPQYRLAPRLFERLAERDEPGELIGVGLIEPVGLDAITGAGPALILDRPASPGNVGSLIRSADAFGAAGVVLLGHAADPYDPQSVRASMGSLFSVPVAEADGAATVGPWLGASKRRAIGLDEAAGSALRDLERGSPVAVVLGTEGRGLSSAARQLCDEFRAIPMQDGVATSLNLAVAGSIALYEVTRDRASN